MSYVITWNVIGNGDVTFAQWFDDGLAADAFYGLLLADKTVSNIKHMNGIIS